MMIHIVAVLMHLGWVQSRCHLRISPCSHADTFGRGSTSYEDSGTISTGDRYCPPGLPAAEQVLAMHVSHGLCQQSDLQEWDATPRRRSELSSGRAQETLWHDSLGSARGSGLKVVQEPGSLHTKLSHRRNVALLYTRRARGALQSPGDKGSARSGQFIDGTSHAQKSLYH